jgi:hypothetical protein
VNKQIVELRAEECTNAAAIQLAIDRLAQCGGVVQLPELDLTLDRGLKVHSGVALCGHGDKTILRKGASRIYPLSGFHNYGMRDIPLQSTKGLEVGMTVSVLDDKRYAFYSTFARITWIDGNWVGLDHGIEADYAATESPRLVTAYPLVYGHGIRNAALRNLTLDGNMGQNPAPMDGCRGGAIYFANCDKIEIDGIREYNFNGEGLSFQMCTRMTIRDSSFDSNTGNGLHPGSGSTNALFENCQGKRNGKSGFFFCVRANHITMRGCTFANNEGPGVSVGTRDCFNLVEDCDITGNGGPGIFVRLTARPTEVHSCMVRGCRLSNNAQESGRGQVEIVGDAHDLIIEHSTLNGRDAPGVVTADKVRNVYLEENQCVDCSTETSGDGFTVTRPVFECGHESSRPHHYRHLIGDEALARSIDERLQGS